MDNEQRKAISEIARLATEVTGVQFTERHQGMIASRLYARLAELKFDSPKAYLSHLKANFDEEKQYLVSLLTTHHTYFFRELPHFEFLSSQGLKIAVQILKAEGRDTLRIWSAACSRGHEAYSLAMWILPWLAKNAPGIKLSILGTDVDPESIKIAQNGVYDREQLSDSPLNLVANHWSKGTGEIANFVRAKDTLRSVVRFQTENLFDLTPSNEKFDFIFCRNVFIYFNQEQIKKLTNSLIKRLQPQGYFFIGISESLNGLNTETKIQGPSIYQLLNAKPFLPKKADEAKVTHQPKDENRPLIKVLCVDDSPTILALLKKILTKESGFEVVATAVSGVDLEQKMKVVKPDLVTLDIHMPEMDGIEYLRKNWTKTHPPVVMISSVSRDNAELAINALKLGASDYIEKPSLGNIAFKTEEIHNKLKSIHEFGPSKLDSGNSVSFQKFHLSEEPDHSLRIILFSLGSREKAFALCRNIGTDFAPTILLLDAPAAVLHSIAPEFELVTSKDRLKLGPSEKLVTGNFYLKDLESGLQETIANAKLRNTSLLLAGKNSSGSKNLTASIEACQVLFEDLGEAQNAPNRKSLKQSDVYFIPLTSFLYQSAEFFTKAKKKAA